MRISAKVLLLAGLYVCVTGNLAFAVPSDADANCAISITVDDIMEWSANFADISDLANITSQSSSSTSSKTTTLYTNGDLTLTADNAVAAQLDNDGASTDTLVTEYKLAFDSVGGTTGNDTPAWETYDKFLNSGSGGTATTVTHAGGDGAVDVTLHVQASNDTGQVADSGAYSCIQTITASWGT